MSTTIEGLRMLGLTEYEARAYDVLVGLGDATAEPIAEGATIPHTKVYAVLDTLQTKGFIEADNRRPKHYTPMRPTDLFDRHRHERDRQLTEAEQVLEARYSERGSVFSGPFWLLKGPQALADRLHTVLSDARHRILCLMPFPIPEADPRLLEQLRRANDRGVHVRILVRRGDAALQKAAEATGAEVRLTEVPIRYLMVDGRHALGSFPVPREAAAMDVVSLWMPAPELVKHLEPAMRLLFDQATRP